MILISDGLGTLAEGVLKMLTLSNAMQSSGRRWHPGRNTVNRAALAKGERDLCGGDGSGVGIDNMITPWQARRSIVRLRPEQPEDSGEVEAKPPHSKPVVPLSQRWQNPSSR